MCCPFLPEDCSVMKDGRPQLMHMVVHPKLPGVYFLGFVQAHGPMIPCVESQMPYVADLIQVGSLNSNNCFTLLLESLVSLLSALAAIFYKTAEAAND